MDRLVKTLIYNNELTLAILDTTDMINEAIKIHKLSPLSAAALGRTMTIATFMSSNLKNDTDKLSVSVNGDGILGTITVAGNSNLDMRGSIINPRGELHLNSKGKLDVGKGVGQGRISVVKSMGLKEPYIGSSRIVNGEIGEDFTAYYTYSEQQPTAIAVGVKIGKDYKCIGAGAVIVQTLPDASEESIEKAEKVMPLFSNISTIIKEKSIEEIIKEYFISSGKIYSYYPKYKCLCSREYIEKILISMGEKELYDIIEKEGKISVNCEFCEKDYVFNKEDVNKLLGK